MKWRNHILKHIIRVEKNGNVPDEVQAFPCVEKPGFVNFSLVGQSHRIPLYGHKCVGKTNRHDSTAYTYDMFSNTI